MTEIATITAWCLGSLWTDRLYATGEPVELTEAEFATLVELGVVSPEPPAAPEPASEPPADPAQAIRDAIAALPAGGFAEDGAPRLDAVKAAVASGTKVTKATLAAVWAEMSKGA